MKHTELRYIQEKSTGLFFGPDHPTHKKSPSQPLFERAEAWLYTEKEALSVIRQRFGGDHGIELVNVTLPDVKEFARWCGRRGGMVRSARKTIAVRKNGHQPKRKRETQTNVTA